MYRRSRDIIIKNWTSLQYQMIVSDLQTYGPYEQEMWWVVLAYAGISA